MSAVPDHRKAATGNDHLTTQRDKLLGRRPEVIRPAVRPPVLDLQIAFAAPAECGERALQRCGAGLSFLVLARNAHEHADEANPLGVLRNPLDRR